MESSKNLERRHLTQGNGREASSSCHHSIWVGMQSVMCSSRAEYRQDDICSNADSVVADANGDLVFVQPHQVSEQFENFLEWVQKDSASADVGETSLVKYAQTRKISSANCPPL